jgi:hypothetical protein
MEVAILATVLGCTYLLVGVFYMYLNAYAIARARKTFWSRYLYAVRCALTWPWVKVGK